MPDQVWTKTTLGPVRDTDGVQCGTADGAGTITITSNIPVRSGFSLTITEGVTVKMGSNLRFRVTVGGGLPGTLNVQGTAKEQVLITSSAVTPASDDWDWIDIRSGTLGTVPEINMQHTIVEYAGTGVFCPGGNTAVHKVTISDCVFRRIANSHIQGAGYDGGGTGTWTIERCVFDKCPTDQAPSSSNNLLRSSGPSSGTNLFIMNVDHCSIRSHVDVSASDIEVVTVQRRSTMTVRNTIMTGTNDNATRSLDVAFIAATLATLNTEYVWYDCDGLGDYVPHGTDSNKDPGYFDTSCSGNQDLRPDYDTGVSTADEFGDLLGALEPYNTPVPPGPTPPPPPEQSYEYKDFIDPTFRPYVCDYDFFQGSYPADWTRELYDRKETSAHVLVVCIQIPNRGIDPSFEFAPGVSIPILADDGETVTVDLGCWVSQMRPVRVERDVTFREYQGSDMDLVFMDWFGRLDPKIVESLFYNLRWKGLRVDIGSWIRGTTTVLRHGRFFLENITRREENTVMRLRDWFLETLNRPLRANLARDLETELTQEATGFTLDEVTITNDKSRIEEITVRFLDEGTFRSESFEVFGSVVGFHGTGDVNNDFLSDDEGFGIAKEAWTFDTASTRGFFVPGDLVKFKLVNDLRGLPTQVIYEYLSTYGGLVEGTDVFEADFTSKQYLLPSPAEIHLQFADDVTLLEACRVAALHGFVTLTASANGTVTLGGFKPTLSSQFITDAQSAICSSNDLKSMETANLDVYNVIQAAYNPVETNGFTHSGLVGGSATNFYAYPTAELGQDFNRSRTFWGETFQLPLELPGFQRGQEGALFAVLQQYWAFFEGTPTAREKMTLSCKLHDLNRDLENIVWIESQHPYRRVWGQVIAFGKNPMREDVELTVVDVSDIVQPPFGCGYAFCDAGHYTDDCWVCY